MRDHRFDNSPIVEISGKMSRGSDVYYRTIRHKIYAYFIDNPNTQPPTLGTLHTRDTFRLANLYTDFDISIPCKLDEWTIRFVQHNRDAIKRNPNYARNPSKYNKYNDPQHLRPYTTLRHFILASYTRALSQLTEGHPFTHIPVNLNSQYPTEIITLFIRLNLLTSRLAFNNQPPIHLPLSQFGIFTTRRFQQFQ